VRRWRLPESACGGGPSVDGCGCPGSPTQTHGGGSSSILNSGDGSQVGSAVAVAPRSRGRATMGSLCGQAAASSGPQGGRASGVPRRASSDGAAGGTRFKRRHGRHEVRTTTIASDILRSGASLAARVMTSICSYVVDDVLQRLPPLIHIVFRLLCFMPTTCTFITKKCTILCLKTEFVYQFTACIFFACTLERQFLNLCYS
jgi:hypothetical protein